MNKVLTFLLIFSLSKVAFAIDVNEPAPDFTIKTLDGKNYTLSTSIGKKPVYLVFWATWCTICRAEIPHIKALYEQHGNEINIVAINVGQDDSIEKIIQYRQEHQLPYTLAFDEGSKISRQYDVVGTPWQVIIDINGIVRYRSHKTPKNLGEHIAALSRSNKHE
jgi:peroxiredoxin